MMDLLKTFSTLALITSALLTLLPEGSMRKTAALVIGLLLTLCWVEGLMRLSPTVDQEAASATLLQPTSISLTQVESNAVRQLSPEGSEGS